IHQIPLAISLTLHNHMISAQPRRVAQARPLFSRLLEALLGYNVDIVSDDPRAGAAIDEIRATSVPLFSR
ncbi:hypothetical protein, partial [Nocardioides rubriscoriae]|uniref:hypothetical protein n=1 Tax=Nocardioides rubriscoriae TaxID=642762 RepID=UPI001478BB11